jgi:hypothetical protein
MNTPVVDEKGNIIGDLLLGASDWGRPFQRSVIVPLSALTFDPNKMVDCTATLEYVTFRHELISSKRSDQRPYVLKVVVVDRPELLMRVEGYRTLPEIWGVEQVPYHETKRQWKTHTHRMGVIGG